jgi:putative sugar O-methyltransferase
MDYKTSLGLAFSQLKKQKPIYQPTAFWAAACEKISKELVDEGVESFRRNTTALSYFVPNFGAPASGLSQEQVNKLSQTLKEQFPAQTKSQQTLDHYLTGKQAALADYRVLLASDTQKQLPYLHTFSESDFGQPIEQFEFDGKKYSRSSLNYLLGLSLLKKHLGNDVPRSVLEIGGGFGTLGEIWSQSGITDWKYIDIDIPPTQFVADYYLKSILGSSYVTGFDEVSVSDSIDIANLKAASVLCSWQIEQLQGEIDLFVNFISFQEMEPDVVENYLHHVDRLKPRWILLRNMREGKQIKREGHAGVEVPIKSNDYLRMLSNYKLIERNVHPFGFETVDGFHSELQLFKRKSLS